MYPNKLVYIAITGLVYKPNSGVYVYFLVEVCHLSISFSEVYVQTVMFLVAVLIIKIIAQ